VPTGENPLQDGVKSGEMDRFRYKSRRLGGGLDALDSCCIRMGGHVDDRDRGRGLNGSRGVDAVHGPVQMDVHEHDMRVEGEGACNRLRAITRQGDDLIREAAALPGHVQRRDRFVLDQYNAGGSMVPPSAGVYARNLGRLTAGARVRAEPVAPCLLIPNPGDGCTFTPLVATSEMRYSPQLFPASLAALGSVAPGSFGVLLSHGNGGSPRLH
jgi:hypothetical protein